MEACFHQENKNIFPTFYLSIARYKVAILINKVAIARNKYRIETFYLTILTF